MNVNVKAAAAGALLGVTIGVCAGVATAPAPYTGETWACQRVHIDELAPEAIANVDRLRWTYPAQRIIVDDRDGTVRAEYVAMLPGPCFDAAQDMQEDEVLVIN